MKKANNIKQASRLTGALLAKKGTAAPSPTSLLLNQQVLNHFSLPEIKSDKTESKKSVIKARENTEPSTEKQVHSVDGKVLIGKSDITKSSREMSAGRRIAMTLRMEREDHLKLRLFSAHTRKSCQVILSEALELYLGENSDKVPLLKIASQNR